MSSLRSCLKFFDSLIEPSSETVIDVEHLEHLYVFFSFPFLFLKILRHLKTLSLYVMSGWSFGWSKVFGSALSFEMSFFSVISINEKRKKLSKKTEMFFPAFKVCVICNTKAISVISSWFFYIDCFRDETDKKITNCLIDSTV